MPLPSPKGQQEKDKFVSSCIGDKDMIEEFPDQKQRTAFCHSQWKNKGQASKKTFVYKDPITRELFYYDRKGVFKKNGRVLVFVKESKGETMKDIITQIDESMQDIAADEKAGYPPNCNEGYVEKDGKCVPENKE